MKIVICSSASFYKEILPIQAALQALGHEVVIPITAEQMQNIGNFRAEDYKTWFNDPGDFHKKTALMKRHLDEVERGDAVLVVNLEKKGMPGYIGGNVLLEMFHGWTHKKPLYILHPVSPELPLYEEVMGMSPLFLNGDLTVVR